MGNTYGIMTGMSSPIIVLLTSDKSPLPTGTISQVKITSLTRLNASPYHNNTMQCNATPENDLFFSRMKPRGFPH